MILDTLLLSGPSLSCQHLYSCVAFSWRGACVHAMNPHRFQHPIPCGLSHEDIWLSVVKFPDIVIIHRGWSERKYHCNYTWTPKHVHTFIFIRTHTHTHSHTRMHARTHARAHAQRHTHKCIHSQTYTHMLTHTHTHQLSVVYIIILADRQV